MSNKQGSMLFFGDKSYQKMIYSNYTCLTVLIAELVLSDTISFNLDQNQGLISYIHWQ